MKLDSTNPKHPKIDIYVTVDGKFAKIHPSLYRHFSVEQFNNLLTKEMTEQLQRTIQRIQKIYKLDVLGIGDAYQRKDYQKWKKIERNWEHGKQYFTTCQTKHDTIGFDITKIVRE
nr:Ger(x)C family spore germination C-terminal domain-containing protein [Bacillus cereus]